jgi:SpoIID/LytB domain protein
MRRVRKVLGSVMAAAVGATLLTVTLVGSSGEAQAAEFYPVPASGAYTIDGRGYGHGHGLSQWGAQGAALKGLDFSRILAFYYPGTNQQDIGNPRLRVHLSGTQSASIRVDSTTPGQPVTVKDMATGTVRTSTAGIFRVITTGNTQRVQSYMAPGWADLGSNLAGPIAFSTADGVTVWNKAWSTARNYRGSVHVVRTSSEASVAVNHVRMDEYLMGVVPKESPPSWEPAALQAQAVAARSYSWYDVAVASGGAWDLCDTTACQVYGGRKLWSNGGWTAQEHPRTNAAVAATSGKALFYNGSPAFTQFSASNGGAGAAGGKPYLVNFIDPYDGTSGNPNSNWTVTLTADYLQSRYPQIGTLSGIRVNSRSGAGEWGGYITSLELVGSKQTLAVSARLNMKSTYWRPRDVGSPFGDLNSVTVDGGKVRLTGWTIDPDTAASTQVHVYVGSRWGGAATASISRPDVGAAYPDKGSLHGFDITVSAGPGIHQVCVFAINLGAGSSNSRIGCSSVDMGEAPIGRLDKAVMTAGQLRLTGWAIDQDTPVDPLDVHVYVNGRFVRAVTAALARADVAQAYPDAGDRHGFDTTIALSPGTSKVCVFGMDVPTRTGNPQLGCATVTFGAPPVGDLNSATVSGTNVRLLGWALDPDTPDSIPVHVYVDGRLAKTATASVARADVGRAYPTHGSRHGFDVTVGLKAGRHSVCVYAIDVVGGQRNPLLRCATVTVGTPVAGGQVPIGNLDSATAGAGGVTVVGWALDRDLPTQSIQVHVYVDGRYTRALTASIRRGDIGAAYPDAGSAHGFSTVLGMTRGSHRVCAYGINVGGGSTNPLLRCVDVRVP